MANFVCDKAGTSLSQIRLALYDRLLYDLAGLDCDWDGILPNDPDGTFGLLPPDATIQHIRALALAKSLCKKFQTEPDGRATDVATLKFLEANARCASWSPPKWDGSCASDFDRELYGEWKRCLTRFFEQTHRSELADRYPQFDWRDGPLDWARVAFFGNNGPGSAIGSAGGSWVEKFDQSTLTYSREFLRDLYQYEVLRSQSRLSQEIGRALAFGWELVVASQFSTVLKTVSEDRAICIEPSLNMFFQKGGQLLLEEQLKVHYHIDLSVQQQLNRQLAYLGSVSGRFATEDQTSASDTISLLLIKDAVPKKARDIILALRTPSVRMPWGDVQLNMVSSMGNALTFPLQTAIFAAAVEAVYNLLDIKLEFPKRNRALGHIEPGNFGVNGDDIIVVTEAHDYLVRLLKVLGFIPNLQKSHNTGFFRESCGGDYYAGQDVRGVYCKTLNTEQDVYSLINRLNAWTAKSGVSLSHTVGYLLKFVKSRLVPLHESDVAGLKVPSFLTRAPIKRNPVLDQFVERSQVAKATREQRRLTGFHGVDGYPYHWVEPGRWYIAYCPEPRRLPLSGFTPLGALVSIVKGEMTPKGVAVRDDCVAYRDRWLFTPRWDSSEVGAPLPQEDVAAMEAACVANMFST